MNERIKLLKQQAGIDDNPDQEGLDLFAKLIVQECCLKLLSMDDKAQGQHNYYKHAALEVIKHFGVEE